MASGTIYNDVNENISIYKITRYFNQFNPKFAKQMANIPIRTVDIILILVVNNGKNTLFMIKRNGIKEKIPKNSVTNIVGGHTWLFRPILIGAELNDPHTQRAPIDIADRIIPIAPKLAIHHLVSVHEGEGAIAPRLRFVHIVPKAGHVSDFADGIGCAKLGHEIKIHDHLKIHEGEIFVELLGISDCKTWHAAVLGVYRPAASGLIHKAYAGIKGEAIKIIGTIDELVDFIHVHIDGIHAKLFGALIKKGITAHIFTIKLHAKLEHAIKLYA